MTLHLVVRQLQNAKVKAEQELSGIKQALQALGAKKTNGTNGSRVMSLAARQKIARAQKARWKLWHKQNGKAA